MSDLITKTENGIKDWAILIILGLLGIVVGFFFSRIIPHEIKGKISATAAIALGLYLGYRKMKSPAVEL